jgi:hypothetical protein
MHGLRRVLFEVRARDADRFVAVSRRDHERAVLAERRLVLADLVALRQVGIEVVLKIACWEISQPSARPS